MFLEEMDSHGVKANHLHGDEFTADGHSEEALKTFGDSVQARLKEATLKITHENGKVLTLKGAGISYGFGTNKDEAESDLKTNKAERAALGLRSERGGERDRLAEQAATRNEDNGTQDTSEEELVSVTIGDITETVNTNPSEDQRKSGKYRKAHFTFNGANIAIENPAETKR